MNELFVELGKYLKSKRKENGMSQSEVAQKLGYATPQFISNFERGLCAPPLPKLKTLIKLFNISQEEVIQLMLAQQEKYWKRMLSNGVEKARDLD